MSALTRFFFRAPYLPSDTWSIVRWWESRRLAYNLAVGSAGILSVTAVAVSDALSPNPSGPGIPLGGILVYGLLANFFFCLGPLVDAFICRRWGRDFDAVGPALFRYGFVFAVGLTLLPVPLAVLSWGVRVLSVLL